MQYKNNESKLCQELTNWYAIYTKSRSEKKVYNRLSDSGYESFLPLVTETKQWSDRKKKISCPLIKSYVFVKVNENNLFPIYSVPGVVSVLKYLGKPAIVKEEEINNLKILTNNSKSVRDIAPLDLKNGTSIVVIKGPFEGLIATYVSNRGKNTVIVNIQALNSFSEIIVSLIHIKEIL